MSDHWSRHLADWGTPERTRATLARRARDGELVRQHQQVMAEQHVAEARFVEGGLDEGIATPYAVFDDAEAELIAEAAREGDTATAGGILADEFGYGTVRVAEALEAMKRMRTGGAMVLAGESRRFVGGPDGVERTAAALGLSPYELEVVAEAAVAQPGVRALTLARAFPSHRTDEALRLVASLRAMMGLASDGGPDERVAERYAGAYGTERVWEGE